MNKRRIIKLIIVMIAFLTITNVKANTSDGTTISFIDYPKQNEVVKDNLKIQGWVMSKEENTTVEAYLNDTLVTDLERKERSDVIQAIKGYGTIEENPTPGYFKEVDISNLPYGDNRLTIKVLKEDKVILTDKVTFKHEKPKTWIYLDYPVTNGSYSSEAKLKVQGWVMSESSNSMVEMEIDGKKIEEVLDRKVRDDVIKVIKGYGTITENPTPGYYKEIDISKLTYGNHIVKIIAKSQSGNVLSELTRTINVRKPKTWIYLDYPVTNGSYASEAKLKVQGWVMSESSNSMVEMEIDGKKIEEVLDRKVRDDVIKVIKGYGTITENPTPGYYKEIDISKLTYGNHIVKIIAKSQSGNVLSELTRTINVRKPKTCIYLDYPVTNGSYANETKLKVQGWVMSESSNSIVEMEIDGKKTEEELERKERSDVIKAITGYGTINENPTPGYYKEIDISKLTYGNHTVKIIAKNQSGNILSELIRTINVKKPKTRVYIQAPTNSQTVGLKSNIDGWVMSEESNVYIKVFVDNNEIVTNSISRVERPDVIKAIKGYGTIEENPTPGFTTSYDFDGMKDGKHVITAKAYSKYNDQEITSTSISVSLKKYDSMIYLDFPTLSTLNSNNLLEIQGWAITTGKANIIKGYIDGKEIELTRVTRGDVLNAYPSYDPTVNSLSGFTAKTNVSNYSDGHHMFTIKLFDELDEVINTYTKSIHLYKNIYQGIDVSEHNGNINWSSVSKSGINFAIIRIGYRGYGTAGNKREDQYFRYNLSEAKRNGIKVGLYFFSQAINYNEGVDEANYVIEVLKDAKKNGYDISLQYPIAFDSEHSTGYPNGRADHISVAARTDAARGFCNTIIANGYRTSIYASRDWFYHNLNMVMLASYDQWLAHYTEDQNKKSNYTGRYQVWQYTSSGSVSGINGEVDRNVSYYNYS